MPASCLPHHIDLLIADMRENPFGFRPTPSCRLPLIRLPHIFPRPQVGGRAGSYRLARAGGDAIHLLLIASPRSLTAFVRYRHDVCLLTGRTTKRRTKRENRTRNGTTGGTMNGTEEWNARMYKKAGGTPSSDFPTRLLCFGFASRFSYRAAFPYLPLS